MVINIYFLTLSLSPFYPVLSLLCSFSHFLSFALTPTFPSHPSLSPSPYSRFYFFSSLPSPTASFPSHLSLLPLLPPSSLSHQDWLTPENKQWPGSGRANEVQGDREVIATRYQVLISPSKKTAPTKPAKK